MAWLKRSDIKNGVITADHIDAAAAAFDFSTTGIETDIVAESTSAAGVTVDGMKIKDKQIDVSALATGEPGIKLPANKADAFSIYDSTGDFLVFDTSTGAFSLQCLGILNLDNKLDQDIALTGTGVANSLLATMSHASQIAYGGEFTVQQITNARTGGNISAVKGNVISLTGSTAGTDHYAFEAACTVGEATADHFVMKQGTNFDLSWDASAAASTQTGFLLGANLADAFSIADSTGDYLVVVSTTGSESVSIPRRLTTTDGVASGDNRVVGGAPYALAANGTAHTNSTDEAVLASYTIPANTIKVGTVVKVTFLARVSANNGATTLTPRLRLGATTLTGTALITGSAVDSDVDHLFTGEFMLIGRAVPGAAAAIVGVGSFSQVAVTGGARITADLPSTNFATNGALLLEMTADWSAADANSVRAEIFTVEIIG